MGTPEDMEVVWSILMKVSGGLYATNIGMVKMPWWLVDKWVSEAISDIIWGFMVALMLNPFGWTMLVALETSQS